MTIVAIADPSLRDNRGHHFHLTEVVSAALLTWVPEVLWLTNKDFPIDAEQACGQAVRVERVFAGTMYDRYVAAARSGDSGARSGVGGWLSRKLGAGSKASELRAQAGETGGYAHDLWAAVQSNGLTTSDHVLFHTADAETYREILYLLTHMDASKLPVIHLCTPYTPDYIPGRNKSESVDNTIGALQAADSGHDRVRFYAENARLAAYLQRRWNTPVGDLSIPPALVSLEHDEAPRAGDRITVAYLGAAREEKGFQHIPRIIEALGDTPEILDRLQFRIQASPQVTGYVPSMAAAVDELTAMASKLNIELVTQSQSRDAYLEFLAEADVMLLPYELDKYRYRGSGIAVETVSTGKVALTTTDSFPEWLRSASGGRSGHDGASYANALREIVADFPAYRAAAQLEAAAYAKRYAPDRYARTLLGQPTRLRPPRRSKGPNPVALFPYLPPKNSAALLQPILLTAFLRHLGVAVHQLAADRPSGIRLSPVERLRVAQVHQCWPPGDKVAGWADALPAALAPAPACPQAAASLGPGRSLALSADTRLAAGAPDALRAARGFGPQFEQPPEPPLVRPAWLRKLYHLLTGSKAKTAFANGRPTLTCSLNSIASGKERTEKAQLRVGRHLDLLLVHESAAADAFDATWSALGGTCAQLRIASVRAYPRTSQEPPYTVINEPVAADLSALLGISRIAVLVVDTDDGLLDKVLTLAPQAALVLVFVDSGGDRAPDRTLNLPCPVYTTVSKLADRVAQLCADDIGLAKESWRQNRAVTGTYSRGRFERAWRTELTSFPQFRAPAVYNPADVLWRGPRVAQHIAHAESARNAWDLHETAVERQKAASKQVAQTLAASLVRLGRQPTPPSGTQTPNGAAN